MCWLCFCGVINSAGRYSAGFVTDIVGQGRFGSYGMGSTL